MATISGRILFDPQRTANPPSGMTGIANVPVVLQNTSTNVRLAVYTNSTGNYSFNNVPIGIYRIVEAYRTPAVPTPGDFSTATVEFVPLAVVPPIGFATNPPSGATDLDCTTPNTLFVEITSDSDNILNRYICNGAVKYTPIESITDACAVISPENLLIDAFEGTMGTFPAGTPANTGVPTAPFPENVPGFIYVLPQTTPNHAPNDGEYTVQNIMNNDNSNTIGAWWRIADHTLGNETGRMMVVNGFNPGAVFFTEDVDVTTNTHYLFSSWILNLFKVTGWANPALGVQIIDQNGITLYSATLGTQIPVNTAMPEWKQIGTVINSYENTRLTVRFSSEGPAAIGNDYAIDDVALQEIDVPIFIPLKTASSLRVGVGDVFTYTVALRNNCTNPLANVTFRDVIPTGLEFVPGSVTVNGSPNPDADPQIGFAVPDTLGGSTGTITFDVIAVFVPPPDLNPTQNQAEMSYGYTPVAGGVSSVYDVASNIVNVRINPPFCRVMSSAFQRERLIQSPIPPNSTVAFDEPLYSTENIIYQSDGTIDIIRRGTYIIGWFIAGMTGFAENGQSYQIRRYDYAADEWVGLAGATNHIKVSQTSGFAVIHITTDEINFDGRATIALFNTATDTATDTATEAATEEITTTFFSPKAGILIFGADFECLENRRFIIASDLEDIYAQIRIIERFIFLSDVTEIYSPTPELTGLGAAVIFIGYNYNFWGIGELTEPEVLFRGQAYYLIRSSQYPALTLYQGDSTIGTLWIEFPDGSVAKHPLRFDGTGIYLTPTADMILPAGTKFSFTQKLILV